MADDIKTSPLIADAISGYGDITKAIAQTVPTEGFIGQQRLANARNAALGTIDVPAFLAKFPEFKTDYDKEQAEGNDPNAWLQRAIAAAPYVKSEDIPRSGGIVDTFGTIAGKVGDIENLANRASRTASVADVTTLSPALAAAYRANNTELFGALGKAGGMVDSGDPYAGYRGAVLGQQQVGPAATQGYGASLAASQGYGATNAMSQGYASTNATSQGYASTDATSQGYTAEQAAMREYAASQAASQGYTAANARAVEDANAQMIGRGLLGQSLYGQGLTAGPSGAAQTLQQRAQQLAASTGQLSQEELRSIQQGSREAFASRGLEMSNPAISAEIGARIAAQRARQMEDLQAAAALNQAYTQDLTANRGFATGLYGQDVSLQSQNQSAAIQVALAKQQAGIALSLADQQALNSASQFGANAANEQARFNAQSLNAAGQFNAGAFNTQAAINAQAVNAASQFGASAANQASAQNAQLRSAASQFGASAANQASLYNAQSANAASQFGAGAANQASLYNANAANTASQSGAEAANRASIYNAQLGSEAGRFNANAANAQAQFNQELLARERQRQIDNLGALGKATLGQTEANRKYQMDVTGGYQNAAYDPSGLLLGNKSAALPQSNFLQNAATSASPDLSSNLNLTLGTATDVGMTNFNRAVADKTAQDEMNAMLLGTTIAGGADIIASIYNRPPAAKPAATPIT